MKKKTCLKCSGEINLNKDIYVLLGTYNGKVTKDESYFHINCWRLYFEEKARDKAMAVVTGMQQKIMPFAKNVIERLKNESGNKDEGGNNPLIIK